MYYIRFQKPLSKFIVLIMTIPRVTVVFTVTASLEDLTIVDNKLFKAICLHQILDPTDGGNRYCRLVLMVFMSVSLGVQIIQLISAFTSRSTTAAVRVHYHNGVLQLFVHYQGIYIVDARRQDGSGLSFVIKYYNMLY